PFQHFDFRIPPSGNGPRINSLCAMQTIRSIYSGLVSESAPRGDLSHDTVDYLQSRMTRSLYDVFKANPVNYFISEKANLVFSMIENLETMKESTQESVMDILFYVMTDLNYVPFKQLLASQLWCDAAGNSPSSTITIVCNLCIKLLSTSKRFHDVFRDVGFLTMFNGMLQDFAGIVPEYTPAESRSGSTENLQKMPVDPREIATLLSVQPSFKPQKRFILSQAIVENFTQMMTVLSKLLDHPGNASVFRRTYKTALFDLMKRRALRPGLLLVVNQLLHDSVSSGMKEFPEIVRLLEILHSAPKHDLALKLDILAVIEDAVNASEPAQAAFRESGGFVAIISTLLGMEGIFIESTHVSPSLGESQTCDMLLESMISVLICAIRNNDMNRDAVSSQIGYNSIEDAMRITGVFESPSCPLAIGGLFALAMENKQAFSMLSNVEALSPTSGKMEKPPTYLPKEALDLLSNGGPAICNPMVMKNIINVVECMGSKSQGLSLAVLEFIQRLAWSSRFNQMKLNQAGLVETLLDWIMGRDGSPVRSLMSGESPCEGKTIAEDTSEASISAPEAIVINILKRLMEVRISSDAFRSLFRTLSPTASATQKKVVLLDLLLSASISGISPPYVNFDNCVHEACAVVVPDFGRPFPPALGYTFSTWLRLEKTGHLMEIPIMTILDDERKTRFEFSIECTSMRFKLLTYKSCVRFEVPKIERGRWYHITIIHQKPLMSNSSLEFFINGELLEMTKCGYLGHPGSVNRVQTVLGFWGPVSGSSPTGAVWSLGPTYFIEEVLLSESEVRAIFNIGHEYYGNFQGMLEKYQINSINPVSLDTKATSTLSSILMSGSKPLSPLGIAEDKILIAFCANNYAVLRQNNPSFEIHPNAGQNDVASFFYNGASPKLAINPSSVLTVHGKVTVVCGQQILDSIWKLGGCSILLKLIETSQTEHEMFLSTCILVQCVKHSWRNSDEMERNAFYETLAHLVKKNSSVLSARCVETLMMMLGRCKGDEGMAILTNTTACKHLLLDPEMWRISAQAQTVFIKQLTDFVKNSKYKDRNIKSLNDIAIVKRLLMALRAQIILPELIPGLFEVMPLLVKARFTIDIARSICIFLMSTIRKDDTKSLAEPEFRGRKPSLLSNSLRINMKKLSPSTNFVITDAARWKKQPTYSALIRTTLLKMLLDILCDNRGPVNYALKFTEFITSGWIMLFFDRHLDPYTIVLSIRIFAKILQTQDSAHAPRMKENFTILSKLLLPFYHVIQIYPSLLAILTGTEIGIVPLDSGYDLPSLIALYKPTDLARKRLTCPEVIKVLMSILRRSIMVLTTMKPSLTPRFTMFDQASRDQRHLASDGDSVFAHSTGLESSTSELGMLSRVIQTTFELLAYLYVRSDDIKEALCRAEVIDDIVRALFPLVSTSETLNINEELGVGTPDTEESPSALGGEASFINPLTFLSAPVGNIGTGNIGSPMYAIGGLPPHLKTGYAVSIASPTPTTATLYEMKSVSSKKPRYTRSCERLASSTESIVSLILAFIVTTCVDGIIGTWKPLQALEIFIRSIPPSTIEAQMQFIEFGILHMLRKITASITERKHLVTDARFLPNLVKFCEICVDRTYQNALVNITSELHDFICLILEPAIDTNAAEQNVSSLIRSLNRITLYEFETCSKRQDYGENTVVDFLTKCLFHQRLIMCEENTDTEFFKSLVHYLYNNLFSESQSIKSASLSIWKLLLLQKSEVIYQTLRGGGSSENRWACYRKHFDLVNGFSKLLEKDTQSFISWIEEAREELDASLNENSTRILTGRLAMEFKVAAEITKVMRTKRIAKLTKLKKSEHAENDLFRKFLTKTRAGIIDVQQIELSKFTRLLQDYAAGQIFVQNDWSKATTELTRERALWGPTTDDGARWKLDFTEGRSRMRKKLRRNLDPPVQYVSKSQKLAMSSTSAEASSPSPLMITEDAASPKPPTDADEGELSNSELASIEGASTTDGDMTPGPTDKHDQRPGNESSPEQDTPSSEGDMETHEAPDDDSQAIETEKSDAADSEEEKNRHILRLLDPEDSLISESFNTARVLGLDVCEGVLLLGGFTIYLVDNYFRRSDGELVDIDSIPQSDRNIYNATLNVQGQRKGPTSSPTDETRFSCRKWTFEDIREIHKRQFLFRNVALEIFLSDGRNFLLTFWDHKTREQIYGRLQSKASLITDANQTITGVHSAGAIGAPESVSSKLLSNVIFGGSPLSELTQKWCAREISNFSYLMHLNTLAGRSYNDLTQYPVFPWILSDYESADLDLTNPAVYRDLSKPMGAQGSERAEKMIERYKLWDDPALPACHYGVHYSSSMIVCSYLMRMEPFTQQYLKLQGGHFDHPDRLFHSIGKSWQSASRLNTTDVRELIPEFFYLPNFLTNENRFDFGTKQSGEIIDDVVLPPWAKGSPALFIERHREALESEYVSQNLHRWIDLVFGYKQTGDEAVKAVNVFHYLSYEGAVDIDAIKDPVEKQATISIIHNFGQTPRQLFRKPHPVRQAESETVYRLAQHAQYLISSIQPVRSFQNQAISDIKLQGDRVYALAGSKIFVLPNCSKYVEWGHLDDSIRLCQVDSGKVLAVFENLHIGAITCAIFSSGDTLITGGEDMTICSWRLVQGKRPDLYLETCVRGHTSTVLCLAVSKSFSILVSGGDDRLAIIWDLNRMEYVRTLAGHEGPVTSVAINDATGDIATCSGTVVRIWTVNGELMLAKMASSSIADPITAVAIYEPKQGELSSTSLVFTGHRKGILQHRAECRSRCDPPLIRALWIGRLKVWCRKWNEPTSRLINAFPHIRLQRNNRFLATGDAAGKIHTWILPDGSGTEVHFVYSDSCMRCATKFSVLDRKLNCRACGGVFCIDCIEAQEKAQRLCAACNSKVRYL
ncbi:uncharacterized protein BJ171DRAFT_624220, partial [Polychytrium aggregatum]|uniref:uncharacterized protein n=1 Tax=Polychytrium aggregatum TaxID=110093 RepID=UPI0022FEBA29